MKNTKIKKLTQREHILARGGVYLGSVKPIKHEGWFLNKGKFEYNEYESVDGLLKIINEIIDNSLDEADRTRFKYANKIDITITDDSVEVKDNGRGVPTTVDEESGEIEAVLAFTHANAGANFEDDTERTTIGMNGLGSYITNCYSTQFKVVTDDGRNKLTINCKKNASVTGHRLAKTTGKLGTTVSFKPDLKLFGKRKIDTLHKSLIEQRLFHLAASFPEIKFTFNKKRVNVTSYRNYLKAFSDHYELIDGKDFMIAVMPNDFDDFKQFSYINGLNFSSGGNHIEYVLSEVVTKLREKIQRRYKSIRPGDIKNKIQVVCLFKNFPNMLFDSQTKEKLTNSASEVKSYIGDVNWDSFINRIHKNSEILEPIIENFKVKEELKKRKELKALKGKSNKTKIRSEKFLAPTKEWTYMSLCEGQSAQSALSSAIGRENIGYFELKGVPKSTWSSGIKSVTGNIELSEITKISGLDLSKGEMPAHKEWHEVQIDNKKAVVLNLHDEMFIDNKWIDAHSLIAEYGSKKLKSCPTVRYGKQQNVYRRHEPQINLNFENVLLSTDADLDGTRIKGLLISFFCKYAPGFVKEGRLKQLNTPMIVLKKKDVIMEYFFDFDSYNEFVANNPNSKLDVGYKKGLGSWSKLELRELVEKHGLEHFIDTFEYTDQTEAVIDNWMNTTTKVKSDIRKEHLRESSFSIFNI